MFDFLKVNCVGIILKWKCKGKMLFNEGKMAEYVEL